MEGFVAEREEEESGGGRGEWLNGRKVVVGGFVSGLALPKGD